MRFNVKDLYQSGGMIPIASSVSMARQGLRNPNYDSMLFPGNGTGVNPMTMTGMKDDVQYFGLSNDGRITDAGIAKAGQRKFNVYGDNVLEYRVPNLNIPKIKKKKKPKFSPSGSVDAKFGGKEGVKVTGFGIGGKYQINPTTSVSGSFKTKFENPAEKTSFKVGMKKRFQKGGYGLPKFQAGDYAPFSDEEYAKWQGMSELDGWDPGKLSPHSTTEYPKGSYMRWLEFQRERSRRKHEAKQAQQQAQQAAQYPSSPTTPTGDPLVDGMIPRTSTGMPVVPAQPLGPVYNTNTATDAPAGFGDMRGEGLPANWNYNPAMDIKPAYNYQWATGTPGEPYIAPGTPQVDYGPMSPQLQEVIRQGAGVTDGMIQNIDDQSASTLPQQVNFNTNTNNAGGQWPGSPLPYLSPFLDPKNHQGTLNMPDIANTVAKAEVKAVEDYVKANKGKKGGAKKPASQTPQSMVETPGKGVPTRMGANLGSTSDFKKPGSDSSTGGGTGKFNTSQLVYTDGQWKTLPGGTRFRTSSPEQFRRNNATEQIEKLREEQAANERKREGLFANAKERRARRRDELKGEIDQIKGLRKQIRDKRFDTRTDKIIANKKKKIANLKGRLKNADEEQRFNKRYLDSRNKYQISEIDDANTRKYERMASRYNEAGNRFDRKLQDKERRPELESRTRQARRQDAVRKANPWMNQVFQDGGMTPNSNIIKPGDPDYISREEFMKKRAIADSIKNERDPAHPSYNFDKYGVEGYNQYHDALKRQRDAQRQPQKSWHSPLTDPIKKGLKYIGVMENGGYGLPKAQKGAYNFSQYGRVVNPSFNGPDKFQIQEFELPTIDDNRMRKTLNDQYGAGLAGPMDLGHAGNMGMDPSFTMNFNERKGNLFNTQLPSSRLQQQPTSTGQQLSPSSSTISSRAGTPGRRAGFMGLDRGTTMQLAGSFLPAIYNIGESFRSAEKERPMHNKYDYETLHQMRQQKIRPDYTRSDAAYNAARESLRNTSSNPAAIRANQIALANQRQRNAAAADLQAQQANQQLALRAQQFKHGIGAARAAENKRVKAMNNQHELTRQNLQDLGMTQLGTGMVDLGKHLANYDMNKFEWDTLSQIYDQYGLAAFDKVMSGEITPQEMIKFKEENPEEFEKIIQGMQTKKQ